MEPVRKIIHIDMDAFYASVEIATIPLGGLPSLSAAIPIVAVSFRRSYELSLWSSFGNGNQKLFDRARRRYLSAPF